MDGRKVLSCPQVKICGLTSGDQAAACAELGAAAIGLVFHPPSPRNIGIETAREITRALPGSVRAVGVMVDLDYGAIVELAWRCDLDAVQLHGQESSELVKRLESSGLPVIKALFALRKPYLAQAPEYAGCCGLLAECGRGKLAGGNAEAWDWSAAAPLSLSAPLVLAGGLSPANVEQAIKAALPDAVDASSSLETAPGIKDLSRVAEFIDKVRCCVRFYREAGRGPKRVF